MVLYDSLLHLYREKLEQEEACFHKACCSYMRIQLAVFSYYLCLLSALRIVASGNATETEYAGNVFVQWFAQNLAE